MSDDVAKLAHILMQNSVDRYVLVKAKDLWNLASWAFESDRISLAKLSQLVGVPREILELKYPTEPVDVRLPE
jgi:hypothetical protein